MDRNTAPGTVSHLSLHSVIQMWLFLKKNGGGDESILNLQTFLSLFPNIVYIYFISGINRDLNLNIRVGYIG